MTSPFQYFIVFTKIAFILHVHYSTQNTKLKYTFNAFDQSTYYVLEWIRDALLFTAIATDSNDKVHGYFSVGHWKRLAITFKFKDFFKMTNHPRIIIVGAGPAGTSTAIFLKQSGFNNVILLDKSNFPRPKVCGGGISPKSYPLLKELGVFSAVEKSAYPIKGLHLVTPKGQETSLRGDTGAYVLARDKFDYILLQKALGLGAEFRADFKVIRIIEQNGIITSVSDGNTKIDGDFVIFCTGGADKYLQPEKPKLRIHSIMAWYNDFPFKPNTMEMYFDKELLPLYCWLFPESDTRVNIGICIYQEKLGNRNIKVLFNEILTKYFSPRLKYAKLDGPLKGAPLLTAIKLVKPHSKGAIWVGEAARITNSATGEGIHQALTSGKLAAMALDNYYNHHLGRAEALEYYFQLIKTEFNPMVLSAQLFEFLMKGPLFELVPILCKSRFLERLIANSMAKL